MASTVVVAGARGLENGGRKRTKFRCMKDQFEMCYLREEMLASKGSFMVQLSYQFMPIKGKRQRQLAYQTIYTS